jgi:hypothetical protein
MMAVAVMIVADHFTRMVRVRSQSGGGHRRHDGRFGDRLGIEPDVDATADQVEIERLDAGPGERVANQRRFIGAIHAADVQPKLGHPRC